MFYPVKFIPIYKEAVWGGKNLKKLYKREVPFEKTAESWDISCRENEMGVIANGEHKGKTFLEYIQMDRRGILGTEFENIKTFPLLEKVIDANDNLSIQVHPNDVYARINENYPFGKNEAWYILKAPRNAKIIVGIKDGISKSDFKKAVEENRVMEVFNELPVRKGDVINIPSGLLHAITAGVVIVEIQQNSDITYRVYDYDREGLDGKKRELQVEKSMDVLDFRHHIPKEKTKGLKVKDGENTITYYIGNTNFALLTEDIKESAQRELDGTRFFIHTCVAGNPIIKSAGGEVELSVSESVFMPAGIGEYEIIGKCKLITCFVPDIYEDFINELKDKGFTMEEIAENTAVEI